MFGYGSVTNIVWNSVWLAVSFAFVVATAIMGPLWLFIVWYLIFTLDLYNLGHSLRAYDRVKKVRK